MEQALLSQLGPESSSDKYISLANMRFTAGQATQRSVLTGFATSRSDAKFYGGRPDALIGGQNIEVSNRLTPRRRPGVTAFGASNVPSPNSFFQYKMATTDDILVVLDTDFSGGDNSVGANGGVLRYSPTASGIYINKAPLSEQTNFETVVNTMYMGDGVDLFKNVGPNLLSQSNTFGTGAGTSFGIQLPWQDTNIFSLTPGQADPLGGTSAWQLVWSNTGTGSALAQIVTPNYTPVAKNTFTFSFWMKDNGSAQTVSLLIEDQTPGNVIATKTVVLTNSWVKYQVTGTMQSGSTAINVFLYNPTTTNAMDIYGAQLEVGGPATTTQITTTKPQGVWLWGITAPTVAPTFTTTNATGSTGQGWQPGHQYNIGDTIVDNNGNVEVATYGGIYPITTFQIASVASSTGVYTGIISGVNGFNGAGNAFVGMSVVIKGFVTHTVNNGTFTITASTATTITTSNSASVAETHAATATIGTAGTVAGTSGTSTPSWNVSAGQLTPDGIQNLLVQSVTSTAGTVGTGATASVQLPQAVTANNVLLVVVLVSHPGSISISGNSNTYASLKTSTAGQFQLYLYWVASANSGMTTISVTGGGSTGTYIAAAEMSELTGKDTGANAFAANFTQSSASSFFPSGGATTTNAQDIILTVAAFLVTASVGAAGEIGVLPTNFEAITSDAGVSFASGTALFNMTMGFTTVTQTGFYNPQWSILSPSAKSQVVGITGTFKTSVGTLQWYNLGSIGGGLTTTNSLGYQWYMAYGNSYTGHISNVSPISAGTGVITGQVVTVTGATRAMTPSGPYSADPQSDLVYLFRNTNGGGIWYQVAVFGNGAAAQAALTAANYTGLTTTNVTYNATQGTWSYADSVADTSLNTALFAPIALLNTPPPAGAVNMNFFAGRTFLSVGNLLYYNTAADNAAELDITPNGVAAESWLPDNVVPFDAPIVRSITVGGGMWVFTTEDAWFVTGTSVLNGGFNAIRALAGHGLLSYNAATVDGSVVYAFTADKQGLMIGPQMGSVEVGYAIGDLLQNQLNPSTAYVVRHVAGSTDNGVFFGDGATGWYRLNPNQVGASLAGEQTPVWSTFASFTATIGGISALGSMQTSAGVTQLLVGLPHDNISGIAQAGPVLVRNLSTFTDLGAEYTWFFNIGSFLLSTAGKLAEVESVTTQMDNGLNGTATPLASMAVMFDEIVDQWETIGGAGVPDPPGNDASISVISTRYYVLEGADTPPVVQHMQLQINGALASTADEILALVIRGALVAEQA